MFAFPFNAMSEIARSNAEMQISIGLAVSRSMLEASSSLGQMNMQSGKRLMDELVVAFTDAIQTKAFDAEQPLRPVQSTQSTDAIQGDQRSSGVIPAAHGHSVSYDFESNDSKKSSPSDSDIDGKSAEHARSHHEHETDPRPSRLVEKLVASVASDTYIVEK